MKILYHLEDFDFCSKSLTDIFPIIIFAIFQFFLKPGSKPNKVLGQRTVAWVTIFFAALVLPVRFMGETPH